MNTSEILQIYKYHIRIRRFAAHYNQRQVAKLLGVSTRHYQRIENGECTPTLDNILNLFSIYNIENESLINMGHNISSDVAKVQNNIIKELPYYRELSEVVEIVEKMVCETKQEDSIIKTIYNHKNINTTSFLFSITSFLIRVHQTIKSLFNKIDLI